MAPNTSYGAKLQDIWKGAKVLSHINSMSKPTYEEHEYWKFIDSQVQSWLYSTCDSNLLQIISNDKCTTKDLWDNLREFSSTTKCSWCFNCKTNYATRKNVLHQLLSIAIISKILSIPYPMLIPWLLRWNLWCKFPDNPHPHFITFWTSLLIPSHFNVSYKPRTCYYLCVF